MSPLNGTNGPPIDTDVMSWEGCSITSETASAALRSSHAPLNPTAVDHTTDAWDTVDGYAPLDEVHRAWETMRMVRAWNRLDMMKAVSVTSDNNARHDVLTGAALLVEDSLIIAMDAEDILTRLGAARVVTAASIRQAQQEIDRDEFQAAVLDVNLGNETSLSIADALRDKGVPYIFATGYGEQLRLPPEHEGTQVIQKPYTLASLAHALGQALRPR